MPGVFKAQLQGVMNEGKARPKRSPTIRETLQGPVILAIAPSGRYC